MCLQERGSATFNSMLWDRAWIPLQPHLLFFCIFTPSLFHFFTPFTIASEKVARYRGSNHDALAVLGDGSGFKQLLEAVVAGSSEGRGKAARQVTRVAKSAAWLWQSLQREQFLRRQVQEPVQRSWR